jgi:hypothetical protein
MTAKTSRARSIVLFMYVSSLRVGRGIFGLVHSRAGVVSALSLAGPDERGTTTAARHCLSGRRSDHRRRPARLRHPAASNVLGGVAPFGTPIAAATFRPRRPCLAWFLLRPDRVASSSRLASTWSAAGPISLGAPVAAAMPTALFHCGTRRRAVPSSWAACFPPDWARPA